MEDLRRQNNISYRIVNKKQYLVKHFVTQRYILRLVTQRYILRLIRGVEYLDAGAGYLHN